MTINPEKYIVFKREDLLGATDEYVADRILPLALDDAVVIRHQDAFAGPALHSYANTIQSTLALLKTYGAGVSAAQLSHLEQLADYFASMGDVADQIPIRHLPD